MKLVVDPQFLEDLWYWVAADARVAERVLKMVDAIRRNPYHGIGRPEPLKRLGDDVWSRGVTETDRLVYMVDSEKLNLLQCRYHLITPQEASGAPGGVRLCPPA